MLKYSVCFRRPEDITSFVNAANQFEGDVDLVSGRIIVDAKSVMGVMALSESDKLEMVVHSAESQDFLNRVSGLIDAVV